MRFNKTLFTGMIMMCTMSVTVSAQKTALKSNKDTKMSLWLYDQYQQQQETALRNNGARHRSQERPVRKYVLALVESTDGDATIRQKGGIVLQDFWDGISAAFLPMDSLGVLDRCEHILRMEANEPSRIMNDTSAIITGVDKVWTAQGALPQAFTGKGVYAGVMDVGFDFTHPAFRNDDGTSRIKWFWDPAAPDVDPNNFGMIYTSPEMVLAARHTTDAHIEEHGTHVMGTMAGNGLDGHYIGMAPEADIIGSYMPIGNLPDDVDIDERLAEYLINHIPDLDGFTDETIEVLGGDTWEIILLYHIFKQADAEGKPCVVNWSFGGSAIHRYINRNSISLYSTLLNRMLGPGHIVVAAAGNEGGKETYAKIEAGQDKEQDIYFLDQNGYYRFITRSIIDTTDTTALKQSITFHGLTDTVKYDLTKLITDTTISNYYDFITVPCPVDSDDAGNGQEPVQDTIWIYSYLHINYGDTAVFFNRVYFPQSYHDQHSNKYGTMKGTLLFDSPQDVELYYWDNITFSPDNYSNSRGAHLGTIDNPGDMERIIAVGAMHHRATFINIEGDTIDSAWLGSQEGHLSSFSSCGPTMDGRIKPDVVAPGVNILSALNSYYPYDGDEIAYETQAFGRKYRMIAMNGTSMATPIVAGIIALWLQAKPDLTPEDILGVIERTSHQPEPEFSGTEKNNYYGWGEIDAYAGLLDILGLTTSVPGLSQHQPAGMTFRLEGQTLYIDGIDTETDITVYDMSGRPVVSTVTSDGKIELPTLPQGVYAVQIGKSGSTLIRL